MLRIDLLLGGKRSDSLIWCKHLTDSGESLKVTALSEKSTLDSQAFDLNKAEMLLREAEIFQNSVTLASTQKDSPIFSLLTQWLQNPENLHSGSIKLQTSFDLEVGSPLKGNPKVKHSLMTDSVKLRGVQELMLIGRDAVVVNHNNSIHVYREKPYITTADAIIKTLNRITTLEHSLA